MTNWQEEIRSALKEKKSLEEYFQINIPKTTQPIFIPLELAAKIRKKGVDSPLGKQFIPHLNENEDSGVTDPIGDFKPGPLPYFIHRYHNRALFFPTTVCPVQCRYCFRKNNLHNEEINLKVDFKKIELYLLEHPEIEEIIFSGGDPLILNDQKLEELFNFFSQFRSLKYLRFHSRVPVILPNRITDEFIALLMKFKQRWHFNIVIHTNHVDEISTSAENAFTKLNDFSLLSQSVLLKDVNDKTEVLLELFNKLIQFNIRPYYLHHPDQVKGAMHFYLPHLDGHQIMKELRECLPGWALPHYVIDSPEAIGKSVVSNGNQLFHSTEKINSFQ